MAAAATDVERGAQEGTVAAGTEEPGEPKTLRERVYLVTDEPGSSPTATAWASFILLCIVASTACFILETVPSLQNTYKGVWYWSELFFVTIFTIEYVVRFIVTPLSKVKFVIQPFNVIDLLAVLPFYIGLLMKGTQLDLRVVRAIRLVRLFRLFKIGKYSTNTQLMVTAMSRSQEALVLLVFFLAVAMILFSTLMYTMEQGVWDDAQGCHVRPGESTCSPFESIPHAFYWAITTMTTVGYGDVLPTTNWGKLICGICMVCGILVIAMPITMIGNTFVESYTEIQNEAKLKQVQNEMKDDDEVHRELFITCQDIEGLRDECDEILRKMKQLLAASMVINDDIDAAEALAKLTPSYDILQRAAVQSIDDLCTFTKTTLPPRYS